MDNKILELCKSVVDSSWETLDFYGAECDKYGIVCQECPFWWRNREDKLDCYESPKKTQEIARRYIEDNVNNKKESDNMNSETMKIIDIFNNWDGFKVGTEFYDEDIEDVVFSKNGYDDVVFKDDVGSFKLDYELIVREPVEYVNFDDIEIGEEFMIEDRDGRILDNTYLKVEVFNEAKVLEKRCNGDIFVVNTDLSKSNEFKFIRK